MRYFLCCLLIACGFVQTAAAQASAVPHDTIATRYQLPGADCTLFPAAATFPASADEYTVAMARFTPTQAQVATTETALLAVHLDQVSARYEMTDYYDEYPKIIKQHLAEYQRQYYGFYNPQHHPCLFINFFIQQVEEMPGRPLHWLIYPIKMYDGGAAFWSVYYDLTTHQFFHYAHNSEG